MAYTITVNNETFILSGTFIGAAINENWGDLSFRNKFRVKIKNKSTGKSFHTTFWDSVVNCEKGKNKVSKDILENTFESILFDAQSYKQSSDVYDFNKSHGLDDFDDTIYSLCEKTYENLENICEKRNESDN